MSDAHTVNCEQAGLWNDTAGRAWVELQSVLDEMFLPIERLLVERSCAKPESHVLDIGCGAGATALSVGRRLGRQGQCLGVDISGALIAAAKQRAIKEGLNNVAFLQADAQTHDFEPERFDSIISRFGVMFFEDTEAAFANIRRAARPGANITFVAWRSPAENPFMTTAARAAAPLLPSLPTPNPNAPGQFGFADSDRVRRILESSRWKNVDIQALDVPTSLAEKDLPTYVTRLGPVGLAMRELDESKRAPITEVVLNAFNPFIQNGAARFTCACWLVSARV